MYYKLNFGFAVLLFVLTITYRNRILNGLTDNVKSIQNLLTSWNVIMLVCLSVLFLHSIRLGYKGLSLWYYLIGGLALIMLMVSIIGIFFTPRGTL
jgi:hypothetical protein